MFVINILAPTLIPPSPSNASLTVPKHQGPSLKARITDTIEEVDEQLTIQSIRGPEKRPTAQSIFALPDEKPVRSAPIDVPASYHNDPFSYAQSVKNQNVSPFEFPNNAVFSSSAPSGNAGHLLTPTINIDHTDDSDAGSHKDDREKSNLITLLKIIEKKKTLI